MSQDVRSADMDDEISIWELINHLKAGWRLIVGGGAIGLVIAIGVVFLIPPQYEATAVVQPATIGTSTSTSTSTSTVNVIEPIAQTLERLRITTFYNNGVVQSCQTDSAKELVKKVKVNIVKGNSLLSISYRASTATLAEECTASIVKRLMQSQEAIAAPLIKELEEQHTLTKQQLEQTERFLLQGEKRISTSSASPASSQALFTLLLLKREDLLKLQKLYQEQRIQMTEPLTQPLKLLEPIYAPIESVAPRKLVIEFGGLIGGLFIGLLVLFARLSWRRYKEPLHP